MQSLLNQHDVHLMTWESDPSKRNGSKITFNIPKATEVVAGDEIKVNLGGGQFSIYTLTDITERRQSSMEQFDNCTSDVVWRRE